jgi:23S rRNA (adenine2503-C2)-methyltransferase
MPIDTTHPLDDVLDAAVTWARASGYAPMWAVTLLEDRNDSLEHARALAERAKHFEAAAGVRPRISLSPYNEIENRGSDSRRSLSEPFRRSPAHARFRDELARHGVFSHERYSGGADIAAACGQLSALGAGP